MYDLNLSVPNISTSKYSDDEKFRLLKNYLYELNEQLSVALSNLDFSNLSYNQQSVISEEKESKELDYYKVLKEDALEKFNTLKNKIIATADEVFENCNAAIEESEKSILLKAEGDFVAKSEFGEYKNEVNTSLSENATAIELNANNIKTANNDLERYKSENNAELNIRATSIMSQVENNFAKKSEHDEFTESISSQVTQTAKNITETFENSFSIMRNDVSTLGGTVADLVYSIDAYIKRGELESGIYGVEIGRNDSNIKARFTNDKLSFLQGDVEIAYISGNNLYILRAEITDYLKIGNSNNGFFIFDVTDNGLEVKWSYGD